MPGLRRGNNEGTLAGPWKRGALKDQGTMTPRDRELDIASCFASRAQLPTQVRTTRNHSVNSSKLDRAMDLSQTRGPITETILGEPRTGESSPQIMTFYIANIKRGVDIGLVMTKDGKDSYLFLRSILFM